MKTCTCFGKTKDHGSFYRNKQTKDRRFARCIDCYKEKNKAYYHQTVATNIDTVLKYRHQKKVNEAKRYLVKYLVK